MDNLTRIKIMPCRLREARGEMTQQEVAERIGLKGRSRVWNYESGRSPIPSEILARFCALYKKPIEFFTNADFPS